MHQTSKTRSPMHNPRVAHRASPHAAARDESVLFVVVLVEPLRDIRARDEDAQLFADGEPGHALGWHMHGLAEFTTSSTRLFLTFVRLASSSMSSDFVIATSWKPQSSARAPLEAPSRMGSIGAPRTSNQSLSAVDDDHVARFIARAAYIEWLAPSICWFTSR